MQATIHNFPHPSTPFVGRINEVRDITARLSDPTCRLLTLVGPGGIGKTHLVLQAARQLTLPNGVYFVPLQPLNFPDLIVSTIANVVGLRPSGSDLQEQLLTFLHDMSCILILDNFEHLLEGSPLLSEITARTNSVKVLITSRERLNLRDEWVYDVSGLDFPAPDVLNGLETYSAVQLFAYQVGRVHSAFSVEQNAAAIVRICRILEGMPLALELAASWARTLSCTEIAVEIERGMDILESNARNIPERHRSIRAVLYHSWTMLTEDERAALRKLSVFRGGVARDAAEEVAGATLHILSRLIDTSWLRHLENGRYDFHELLRQYATEKLAESRQADATEQSHLEYFLKLAEGAEARKFGREQVAWYDRLDAEMDNLRAAMNRSQEREIGLRLVAALGWFFSERNHTKEGSVWLERAIAANLEASLPVRIKALRYAAVMASNLVDVERVIDLCAKVQTLASLTNNRLESAWALCILGYCNAYSGGFDAERDIGLLEQSIALFREIKDPEGLSHTLFRRALFALDDKDFVYARTLLDESAHYAHESGDLVMIGWEAFMQANLYWKENHDYNRAKASFETALSVFHQAHFQIGINPIYLCLAGLEQELGNLESAKAFNLKAMWALRELSPYHSYMLSALVGQASLAEAQGRSERAARLLGAISSQGLPPKIDKVEIATFEDLCVRVRSQLGEKAFIEAWATGQAMNSEQAAVYAQEGEAEKIASVIKSVQPLTKRELEILRLVADGLSNGEIAQQLHFTVSTVKWYLSEIYSKLDAHSRAKAVAYAREKGLLA